VIVGPLSLVVAMHRVSSEMVPRCGRQRTRFSITIQAASTEVTLTFAVSCGVRLC